MSIPDQEPASNPVPVPAPTPTPMQGNTLRKPLGDLAAAQHKKLLRSAKIAIMVVALLTMGANGFNYYRIDQNAQEVEAIVAAARGNPNMTIDSAKVAEARDQIATGLMLSAAYFFVGVIFFGLFFMINSKPATATAAALILYIVANIAGMALNPESIAMGIIIKLLIIAILYKGMQAGTSLQKLRDKEAMVPGA